MMKSTHSTWFALLILLAPPAWSQGSSPNQDHPLLGDRQESSPVLDIQFDDGPKRYLRPVERPTREAMPILSVPAEREAVGKMGDSTDEWNDQLDMPSSNARERVSAVAISVANSTIQQLDWDSVFKQVPRSEQRKQRTTANAHRDPHSGLEEQTTFSWSPRVLAHRTLYLEDMPLERYGQSCGRLQPLVSSLKFFADVATMPLQRIHEKPCDLHYVLPLDRPGTCTPGLRQPVVPYVPSCR